MGTFPLSLGVVSAVYWPVDRQNQLRTIVIIPYLCLVHNSFGPAFEKSRFSEVYDCVQDEITVPNGT